ncbi:tetratricopeptide repeat protein [Lactobacillus sp.]|uniref:tetratricopeptide repeat protein n=1 Tax=Lactobacillus sp. TaxID=1591 RepID=UPI0025F3A525|nr:tetratricopeptide repeat protein [Lactobacillus sp.]MCO6532659.1 tetratricopeptide repeat protein [Lactobacillus sp.]
MTNDQNNQAKNKQQSEKQIHDLITKIDVDPQNTENYLKLATCLIEQGSFDQATQLLEQAKHLVKNPQDLDYDLAVCLYLQGDFAKALELLNQIPNDDLVLYQKALVFLKLGQRQKALAHALTIKNIDNRVKELLGDIWLSLGDLTSAKSSYQQINENQRSAKVNFMLGITTLNDNRKEAEEYLRKAKQEDPKFYQQAQEQYDAILKMINDSEKKND